MFNEIEDFRFNNRFQTRSEATAELIRIGLEAVQKQLSQQSPKPPFQGGGSPKG